MNAALILFSLSALAKPTSDETIQTVVDTLYGKPVPKAAVCIARPELPEEVTGDPVAIGVMRGNEGCRLLGVMVNGGYLKAEVAFPKALDADTWSGLKQTRRGQLLQSWTTQVLLAFDQFDAEDPRPTNIVANGGTQVTVPFWQRTEERRITAHTQGVFNFDRDGVLVSQDRDNGERWKSVFTIQHYRSSGVSENSVHAALQKVGRNLHVCFEEAWRDDYLVHGRKRFQWTIRGGGASQIGMVAEDDDGSPLGACYNRVLHNVPFPPELGGTTTWGFSITRVKQK